MNVKRVFSFFVCLCLLYISGSAAVGSSAHVTPSEAYDSLSQVSSAELLDHGRTYFSQGKAAEALTCFTIVGERYQEQMDTAEVHLCIRALNNCGCVYKYFYFDYPRAYDYFCQASDLCEQHHFDDFLPVIMVNLGDLLNDYSVNYRSESLFQQSRQVLEHAMERAISGENWELMTTAFFNLAYHNFDLDLSKYTVLFSDDIPSQTPDLEYVRLQYRGIASVQKHDYARARELFLQQLPQVTARWAPERDTLSTYLNIAHTFLLENDNEQAVTYLLKALDVAEAHNVYDHQAGICNMLSKAYAQMGDDQQKASYHLKYLEIKEEIDVRRMDSIGELDFIRKLKKEELKAQQMALVQRIMQYAILAGLIVLVVIVAFALMLWRKNSQLTARNKSLYNKNKQVMEAEAEAQRMSKVYEEMLRHAEEEQVKYSRSNLNDEQRERLLLLIQQVLSDPEQVCQQDFTLGKLAKMVNSNTTYVSQVVNEKYNMAFSNVLGSYRIKEACRRIADTEHYGNVTIEAISASVGFKSRTAFVNAFKRETGLTPSEYQRMSLAEKR